MVTKPNDYTYNNEPVFCLSTDTKPIDSSINNGRPLIEMDTGKIYFFSAENKEWLEFSAS